MKIKHITQITLNKSSDQQKIQECKLSDEWTCLYENSIYIVFQRENSCKKIKS